MVLHQQGRSALLGMVVSHMLRITIKHGVTQFTPEAFATLGAYMASHGDRLGALAEKLLRQAYSEEKELTGRSYFWIAACTKWWIEPMPPTLGLLIMGNEQCMASGSIAFACHCHVLYATSFYYSGLPLQPLLEDVENICSLCLEYRQTLAFLVLSPLWQCLLNLTGLSNDPTNMEAGEAFEKRRLVANTSNAGQQVIYSFWMQTSFFFGKVQQASECANKLTHETRGLTKAMAFYPSRLFFFALIDIANFRQNNKRKLRVSAEKHTKILRALASSGAINVVHKVQLLDAELLSLASTKPAGQVCKSYDTAIISASRAGFLQDAALANLLCFQYCSAQNLDTAGDYLRHSFSLWQDWNAFAVADYLSQQYPDELDASRANLSNSMSRSSGGYRSRTRFNASTSEQHKRLSM